MDTKISGLSYIDNFITIEEEKQLIESINSLTWNNDLSRRTQHYGHKYIYAFKSNQNNDGFSPIIPQFLLDLFFKVRSTGFGSDVDISKLQIIINEYKCGQGISPHIDDPKQFGDWVIGISLGSDCIMNFNKNIETVPQKLKQRSIYQMIGDARIIYKHEIPPRQSDNGIKRQTRISITFRYII